MNTHGHSDHISGNGIIREKFHVSISIHEDDVYMLGGLGGSIKFKIANILLHDLDVIKFGEINLKVVHTPGHTSGSISLLGEKEVFTGDTLFAGSIGRTDLPESSERNMKFSLKKLTSLPDNFTVYPGHGPPTTIDKEKRNNPFL